MAVFYLHTPHRSVDPSAFAAAVRRELKHYARPPFTDASVGALYIGGRPSRLPPSVLRTLLDAFREKFDVVAPREITLELAPSDASPAHVEALRRLGITRLSIEARSLVDPERQAVGAVHSSEAVRDLIRHAQATGFEGVSVDLMFGGSYPSRSTWKASLQRVVDLRVPHVALHELDANQDVPGEDDGRADRFAVAMTFLDAKGYEQYELTHFARPGHRSHYQEHVYAHENVLGLGPGAESFWWPDRDVDATADRWSNVTEATTYVEQLRAGEAPVANHETLDRPALAREYILLRLRTNDGLNLDVLADRYDWPLRHEKSDTLRRLAAEGLIHDDPDHVRLTAWGRLLADAITQRLIREE